MTILKWVLTGLVAMVVVFLVAEGLYSIFFKGKRRMTRAQTREVERQVEAIIKEAQEKGTSPSTKRRFRPSFSQFMLFFQTLITIGLIVTCIWLKVTYMMDVSDLTNLVQYSFGLDGAWGGFYLWKSKNENRAKYAQQFVLLFADKYGPDFAVQLAQVVLKD